jgi:hypothetical protein
MLKVDDLKSQLKSAITNTVKPAIKQVLLASYPVKSNQGDEMAERLSQTFDELVSEQLATLFAQAIDYYIKNASITGTIITAGSPVTQTAVITSLPTPVTNGKVPNTLGIS